MTTKRPASASAPDPDSSAELDVVPSSAPSFVSSWLTDWFGVAVLFMLWLGLLFLTIHIVVIPRTYYHRWPLWIPYLGGLTSYLTPLTAEGSGAAFTLPRDSLGVALGLVGLGATPLWLSFGVALIAKWQQAPRIRHRFYPEGQKEQWGRRERSWKQDIVERNRLTWSIEASRARQAQHRMMQHASLFGFAVSTVLSWGIILNNDDTIGLQTRMMAIAAASAAVCSFALSFGRISVRASIRDTSARMFAYALRGVITSVLAVMLLCTLLWHNGDAKTAADQNDRGELNAQPLKNPTSFVMVGMLVALIGESVLGQLTGRAASVMNLSHSSRGLDGAQSLDRIEGLSEQDVVRLAEEGVDTMHALAMASTPYLYFSTPYSLQRICDWQDQALLITKVGFAMAQSCREKLMIRGGIALQRKADFLITTSGDSGQEDPARQEENAKIFEIIRSALGFISVEQARESLYPLANDEAVRRLRIYARGSVGVPEDTSEAV